jgi:hypothetical protein
LVMAIRPRANVQDAVRRRRQTIHARGASSGGTAIYGVSSGWLHDAVNATGNRAQPNLKPTATQAATQQQPTCSGREITSSVGQWPPRAASPAQDVPSGRITNHSHPLGYHAPDHICGAARGRRHQTQEPWCPPDGDANFALALCQARRFAYMSRVSPNTVHLTIY